MDDDRRCSARDKYWSKEEADTIKKGWDNKVMKRELKFKVLRSKVMKGVVLVSEEMQINIRTRMKELLFGEGSL